MLAKGCAITLWKHDPAAGQVGRDRAEHMLGGNTVDEPVETYLKRSGWSASLEPNRTADALRLEHRCPWPQVWLLDFAGASAASRGKLLVNPRDRQLTPRR
jgi:hypothetical protein